jgi:hypothetical protein
MPLNAFYQFVVLFFNYRTGTYIKVSSIQSQLSEGVLDSIFAIMNGEYAPEGVRVRPFFNTPSLRAMRVGDVIEVNGKAYYASEEGWVQTTYSKDHDYERYSSPINDILHATELAAAAIPA